MVVFSERIPTLRGCRRRCPSARVRPETGQDQRRRPQAARRATDKEQQQIVEDFGLAAATVRLLFTGDIASEGVNLHRQCHHLIHYDLPWSLIRIEQRNGRIDRYGQSTPPSSARCCCSPATWTTSARRPTPTGPSAC